MTLSTGIRSEKAEISKKLQDLFLYQREMAAFSGISQIDKKILITNDDMDYSTSNVEHIRLKDFLMYHSLEEK